MNDAKYLKLNLHKVYVDLSKTTDECELINIARKYGDTKPRLHEIASFKSLIFQLENNMREDFLINYFDDFYMHFDIVRPSKEFDLLKISKRFVLNIELKSKTNQEDIKSQLGKNAYYLRHLEKTSYLFSFDENNFYQLKENRLDIVGVEELVEIIKCIFNDGNELKDISELFSTNAYLVSPLNNANKFIKNEYFLTDAQQNCKIEVLNLAKQVVKRQTVTTPYKEINGKMYNKSRLIKQSESVCCAIVGGAGTGKTLLLYDIAKSCNGAVAIIHSGKLCKGHKIINSEIEKIDIYGAYDIENGIIPFGKYTFIFIDEAQRLYRAQLKTLLNVIKENEFLCIFSFDEKQMITNVEHNMKNSETILSIEGIEKFNLTKNIRVNDDILDFTSKMFDLKKIKNSNFANIKIEKSSSIECAKEIISKYRQEDYVHIEYIKSSHISAKQEDFLVNMVFGQEFDNVVMTINEKFYYDGNKLKAESLNHRYYLWDKMLYQGVTRAIKKLAIIVINNDAVYEILNDIKLGKL